MLYQKLGNKFNSWANFFDKKGIGEIRNSKVLYKATYWDIDSTLDEKEFIEGEKVVVLKTHKNSATIQKK